jgi:microcystin-dependent protein
MADEYILKDYAGGAEATTLASGFTIGGTTLTVADGSSYPTGTGGPFVVVVDRGLASEEKFLIDTTSGTNGVTFNIQQAGYDGTTTSNHSSGATVEHCIDAYTLEQANRYVNLQTSKGDLVAHTGTTTARHAVGSNNTVLVADSAQSNGIKWSTIDVNSLASGAVTLAKLASAVQELLVPAGTIVATVRTTADTGWLFLNGTSVPNAQTLYPLLYAATSGLAGWWSGSTFTPPNMANKMLEGVGATSLGASGGSNTVTLTEANLPPHAHTVNPPSTAVSISDPGHDHTSSVIIRTTSGSFGGAASGHGGTATTDAASANIGNNTTGITASVDIAQFNSGNGGGSSSSLTVTNAHVAVNYQIKAH